LLRLLLRNPSRHASPSSPTSPSKVRRTEREEVSKNQRKLSFTTRDSAEIHRARKSAGIKFGKVYARPLRSPASRVLFTPPLHAPDRRPPRRRLVASAMTGDALTRCATVP